MWHLINQVGQDPAPVKIEVTAGNDAATFPIAQDCLHQSIGEYLYNLNHVGD
jgi:hypothetical protein